MGASKWKIRSARGADLNFLYATWLNSYRCDSAIGRSTKKSVFFAEYYAVLDSLFEKPTTKTVVACLPDDDAVILGFLVFERLIVHYAFTKQSFRRMGIARSLFEEAFQGPLAHGGGAGAGGALEIQYSHLTRQGALCVGANPRLVYNPFLLFDRAKNPAKNEAENGK